MFQNLDLWKYLFISLVVFQISAHADYMTALQHRVHHGRHTRNHGRYTRIERDHGAAEENEVIDEEPNGEIDFSQAVPQKDGSLCVTKVKYLEKLEKAQV